MTARFRLVELPVPLFVAAEGLWKGLLREYLLRGLGGAAQAYGPAEVSRAGLALDAVSAAIQPLTVARKPPARTGVKIASGAATPADFAVLQAVLDDAVRLSRAGGLLSLPPLPEIIGLRNWICDEAIRQASGAPPMPWQLPAGGSDSDVAAAKWSAAIEPTADACWLIGDDHNRIVAASDPMLEMLGWAEHQLVGQRLLAVIPPEYREAHLASFTRTVVDGRGRLLGIPLDLFALASDGSSVPVTLTLTRHSAAAGRTVFLGVMTPRTEA